MLVEVQSGTKPGRPTLLVLVSAGFLALSLGAAWFQTHEKLALAEPRPLAAGSPLIIRPPRGWIEGRPGMFVLLRRGAGDEGEDWERRVIFTHRRVPGYVDPRDVILNWDQREAAASMDFTPAQIGGIDGVEAIRRRRLRAYGGIIEKETVLRVACSPKGDIIGVEYWPLESLTVADEHLMDAICDAIQLSTISVRAPEKGVMEAAGVSFAVPEGCAVVGSSRDGLPAVYLQSTNPLLPFIVEIRRTWLASGREPADLLADYCRVRVPWLRTEPRIVSHSRADRIGVFTLYLPSSAGMGRVAPAVLLRASNDECVMLTFQGKGDGETAAGRIALDLAATLAVKPCPVLKDLASASEAGVELADLIRSRGALPWWARSPRDMVFVGRAGPAEVAAAVRFAPEAGGGATAGYSGSNCCVDSSNRGVVRSDWRIDGSATVYSLEFQKRYMEYLDPEVVILERRDAGESSIRRRIIRNGASPLEMTIQVGPEFVAPPVESIAAAWVARREEGAWLIAVSNPDGSVCSRLLLALPPSGLGERRALVVDDYDPTGWVARFDGDDEPLNVQFQGLDLERTDGDNSRDAQVLKLLRRAERSLPGR